MIMFPGDNELTYLSSDSCLDFEYIKCQYLFLSDIKLFDNSACNLNKINCNIYVCQYQQLILYIYVH